MRWFKKKAPASPDSRKVRNMADDIHKVGHYVRAGKEYPDNTVSAVQNWLHEYADLLDASEVSS